MARPNKRTVDYFPHYVDHGRTMFIIDERYKNDGYAFWFRLLEILGKTEGHCLNLNDDSNLEFLLSKTHSEEGFCFGILDLLSKLGAIDPELWENKLIWSQNFVDNLVDVYKRRGTETPLKPSLCEQKPSGSDVSASETPDNGKSDGVSGNKNTQSKVKESKGEENISSPSSDSENPEGVKSKKKKTYSDDAFQLATELAKLILKNDGKYFHLQGNKYNQTVNSYAEDIDKMIRIDKVSVQEVKRTIYWCQSDVFWWKNILSGKKLREQYPKLRIEMDNIQPRHKTGKDPTSMEDMLN